MLDSWQQTLEKLGIIFKDISEIKTRIRICLTAKLDGSFEPVCNVESALNMIQKSENRWANSFIQTADKDPTNLEPSMCYGGELDYLPEEYHHDVQAILPSTAFGFWLFPREVVDLGSWNNWESEILDSTRYWPELISFSPPDETSNQYQTIY
jgi:hypothetical protein